MVKMPAMILIAIIVAKKRQNVMASFIAFTAMYLPPSIVFEGLTPTHSATKGEPFRLKAPNYLIPKDRQRSLEGILVLPCKKVEVKTCLKPDVLVV